MKIVRLEIRGTFRYVWLKTVKDVDLTVHCARCLIGEYDERITAKKGVLSDLLLQDEVYYLCGVTMPYRWKYNFHLAFKPCQDNLLIVNENGIYVEIQDAERIAISADFIDKTDEHSKVKAYCTCRNWQFAHIFKYKGINVPKAYKDG